jgi:hypothetical protein
LPFQEDYKTQVEKYCAVRDDFERKMTLAAKHFQANYYALNLPQEKSLLNMSQNIFGIFYYALNLPQKKSFPQKIYPKTFEAIIYELNLPQNI